MGVACPQSGYTSKRTDLGNSQCEALTGRQTPQLLSKTHSRTAQAASVLDLGDGGIELGGAHTTQSSTDFYVQCVY